MAEGSLAASGDGCVTMRLSAVVKDHQKGAPFVLVSDDGRHFRTLGQDFIPIRKWRSGDPLQVCGRADDRSALDVTNVKRQETLAAQPDVQRRTFADTCVEPRSGDTAGEVIVIEEGGAEPRVSFAWSEGALMAPVMTSARISPDGRMRFDALTASGVFHFEGRIARHALTGLLTEPWRKSPRAIALNERGTATPLVRCRGRVP